MKRHAAPLVLLLLFATSLSLNRSLMPSRAIMGMDVVINEFDSNPPSPPQWVELYNPADFTQDVSLWKIITQSTGIEHWIPIGTVMAAKGYLVVNLPIPIIDPSGDSVILRDKTALEIDRTPLLSKPVKDGNTWSRVPNGVDTNSILDWKLQPATKGASNTAPPPPPAVPTIICTLSSFQLDIGSSVTVRVAIGPARSAPVTIQIRKPGDADWSNLTTALTEASGVHTYAWTPEMIGTYSVRAYVYPSDSIPEMYSFPVNLLVAKIRTQLSCFATRFTITLGQTLATYGYLIPAIEGANITLTYRKPTGAPIVRHIFTGSGGLYNDTAFTPQEAGSWNVTASWNGDETHMAAASPLVRFNVEQPPAPPFGMWLILSLVISVTVATLLLAAGLSSKAVPKPPRRAALCPNCRSTLLYVPSIEGWYCSKCKKHI